MIRYLTHTDGRYWRAAVLDDVVEIRHWAEGEEPQIDVVDTWSELEMPPEYSLDDLAAPLLEAGYHLHPIPDVHLVIEAAHGATLPEEVRAFYANETYLLYQYKRCRALNCEVDFVADSVLGNYMEEHWDAERGAARKFVPISARIYDDYEDEQQWIGIDPSESPTAVYALYTSGSFEPAYDTFEAFLADLETHPEQ